MLGDTLSRAPHAPRLDVLEVTNIHKLSVELRGEYSNEIETDPTLGPIWKKMNGNLPDTKIQLDRINHLKPKCNVQNGKSYVKQEGMRSEKSGETYISSSSRQ